MKKNKYFYLILFAVLLTIGASRLPGLLHGSTLHTDERVFLTAAENLSKFLLGQAASYETPKFYPEGGFTLHTPMQLLRLALHLGGERILFGRLNGLLLFLAGTALGASLLRKYYTKDIWAQVLYLLTMAFGLIHVEQSRYATGDTGTFVFLMVLLLFSFRGAERKRLSDFLLASIAGGILCAVKYPLVFFLLIPYLGFRKAFAGSDKKIIAKGTRYAAGCFLLGFLLLSPKTLTNPTYLFWTAAHETHNYMAGTNLTEVGGPLNHLIAVVTYTLAYSGIPLLAVWVVCRWGRDIRRFREMEGTELMGRVIIPAVCLGFFVYNLFVKAVFMRTYYPFFCILELYCAQLGAQWLRRGGWKKRALAIVCSFMVLRGSFLLTLLATDDGTADMKRFLKDVPRESYTFITELKPGHMAFYDSELPMPVVAVDLADDRFAEDMHLQKGELLITTYQAHGIGTPYVLPIRHKTVRRYIALWETFRAENAPYYLGKLYPDWYYLLLGFDIKGTTGMIFEFPANEFYLNPIP